MASVSAGVVVECTAASLADIGDRTWASVVGIPSSTVVRGTIGAAVDLHRYHISFEEALYRDSVVANNNLTRP